MLLEGTMLFHELTVDLNRFHSSGPCPRRQKRPSVAPHSSCLSKPIKCRQAAGEQAETHFLVKRDLALRTLLPYITYQRVPRPLLPDADVIQG